VPRLSDGTYPRKGQQEREESTHGREKISNLNRCRKLGKPKYKLSTIFKKNVSQGPRWFELSKEC
jgi:hypothetical protein